MQKADRFWVVIPAAGSGVRMGGAVPKQYLPLAGRTVIEHVLNVFLSELRITGITVAIGETDTYWRHYLMRSQGKPVRIVKGGAHRVNSVLNALYALRDELHDEDWILVHDAVRPCLHPGDLERLIETLRTDPVGGILATPLVDTVKCVDHEYHITATPARHNLWRAFTPQMFRYGLLADALNSALERGEAPTDDAAAVQSAGHAVRVVEGRSDNIKITRPGDLALAEAILNQPRGI